MGAITKEEIDVKLRSNYDDYNRRWFWVVDYFGKKRSDWSESERHDVELEVLPRVRILTTQIASTRKNGERHIHVTVSAMIGGVFFMRVPIRLKMELEKREAMMTGNRAKHGDLTFAEHAALNYLDEQMKLYRYDEE